MPETADISLWRLLSFSTLLILPIIALYRWKLIDLTSSMLLAVLRMIIQLLLIGLYLKYLFELNNLWLNIIWLLVMLTVANISIIRGARLSINTFFYVTQVSLGVAVGSVCCLFLLLLIEPDPMWDARYLIPVAGMLLGNCLQGNIRALETFYSEFKSNEASYHAHLLLGATVVEATMPFFQKALRSSLTPAIGSMATLGIVSLPGMMTGQILGGAVPMTAAKYQIAIMIGIFLSMFFAIAVNLRLSLRTAFDSAGLLDETAFREHAD